MVTLQERTISIPCYCKVFLMNNSFQRVIWRISGVSELSGPEHHLIFVAMSEV